MGELKPCPFCGNDEIKVDRIDGHMCAWCTNCTAQGPTSHFGPDGTAQGAWNDVRTAEDDLRARAEAAEAELVQARADALWLAVLWNGTNRNRTMSYMADNAVRQLHGSEQAVLTELWDRFEATNEDIVALLRRVLSARHET